MHDSPLILRTARLVLTLPPPSHGALVAEHFRENLAHLAPWSPPRMPSFYTEDYWCSQLEANRDDLLRGAHLRMFVRRADDPDGMVLGACNLNNIVRGAFQACHLGYHLDHRVEGMGMVSEACTALVDHAFDVMRLHRVMAGYRVENVRSGRVLARLGFAVECVAPRYLFIDGAWRDHVLTARINPRDEAPSMP